MPKLEVERLGGLAGFGNARSRLRSRGELDTSSLSASEKRELDALFANRSEEQVTPHPDGFLYRITRHSDAGRETITTREAAVPAKIASCVKDELI